MENIDNWTRMSEEVRRYLVDGVPDINSALLLSAFPGAGKTYNVLLNIYRHGKKFIYLAPEHEVVYENVEGHDEADFDFVHFQSRERVCLNQEYLAYARDLGMPLRPLCDTVCGDKERCPYYLDKARIEGRNPPSWAGVHSHIISYLRKYLIGTPTNTSNKYMEFDVLVVEENPITSLMKTINLSAEGLANIEQEASLMVGCNEEQLSLFCDILEYLAAHTKAVHDYARLMRKVMEWRAWNAFEWAKFHDKWEEHIAYRIMGTRGTTALRNVPKDVIMLMDDMFRECDERTLPHHVKTIGGQCMLSYFYGNELLGLPIRIIGLDGTANTNTWGRILGKQLHTVAISKPFRNVYQLVGGNYPQSSWVRNDIITTTGVKLLELVRNIIRTREGKTLLIGTKRIIDLTKNYLDEKGLNDRTMDAHYYALRSKNFVGCDSVILLVRPSPREESIQTYIALSGWPEETWRDYFTRDEMLQAIARIRANLDRVKDRSVMPPVWRDRKRIEIFVLCNCGRKGEPGELFTPDDVEEETCRRIPIQTLENYIMTGKLTPSTKKEDRMGKEILAALEGRQLTKEDLIRIVQDKWTSYKARHIDAFIDKMIFRNQIRRNGDYHELVG